MGIIKAVFDAIGGGFADSWQEVLEADQMTDTTVMAFGTKVRANDKRNSNKKGTQDLITNGSIIHVYPNQFMMLIDGGKIVDFTAEEGYYKVDNAMPVPSLFSGQFGSAIKETFSRVKYGGVPSTKQIAVFINLQEIKGIKFGTRSPINYFDNFYNSELFLRAHGTYSVKITDPIKFYMEAVSRAARRLDITDINEQYMNEFLEALQASINRMSSEGIRISHVTGKAQELSRYMADALDDTWKQMRGMEIQAVGIGAISYDEESKALINLRNRGAMLGDPTVREGYVQGAVAEGMRAAGSNANGSAAAFMGMGIGMNAAGGFMSTASATNAQQMAAQQAAQQQAAAQQAAQQQAAQAQNAWTCACGAQNTGKFCSECGAKKPEATTWTCTCGAQNKGKFCSNCGSPKPAAEWECARCGEKNPANAKFCSTCGTPKK